MRYFIARRLAWIEQRTGLQSTCSHFLLESVPASVGWPQVFGSVALFLFLVQVCTGICLAFNYAPTPGDAYKSLLYITHQVAAGRMMHALHHWGASLMVIVVFLHMAQVFIYSAYLKPREATWMAGVVLLLLTLAFGLTGYLLPWDNRAFWGTMVTARIMGSVPSAGKFITQLIGASDGIGVLTFSRFYALHTLVLPALTTLLILFHIYLVRRHGITADATASAAEWQKFYPKQAFRDTVAIFIAFAILFTLAALIEVPLERVADPTDTSYVPRPEWYFLFLFQLLKIFQGQLEPLGTVVLPTAAVALLFLVPCLRGRWLQALHTRSVALTTVALVFGTWAILTGFALTGSEAAKRPTFVPREAVEWAVIPPEEIAGFGYFQSSGCAACHNLLIGRQRTGPNLLPAEHGHPKEWLAQHFKHPEQSSPRNNPSRENLSLPQLNALALFISNLNPGSLAVQQRMSSEFIEGAQVYGTRACASCHKVNGVGGGVGPTLNGLADRRGRDWVEKHFAEPQALSPGSIMPSYRFSNEERKAIVLYLFSLPE